MKDIKAVVKSFGGHFNFNKQVFEIPNVFL